MQGNIKPNFLLVGAARCGTSSLYNYLRQHPEVFMPGNKELRYFVSENYLNISPEDPHHDSITEKTIYEWQDYLDFFKDAADYKAIGEASVTYLYYYETSIPKIKEYLGDINILILIRNPVDRALSAHNYLVMRNLEHLSFEECLMLESKRMENNWIPMRYYVDLGMYYNQVKAFMKYFSNVNITLNRDLENKPEESMKRIFNFLDVDETFIPNLSTRHNISGKPKSEKIHDIVLGRGRLHQFAKPIVKFILPDKLLRKIKKKMKEDNILRNAVISTELRAKLIDVFKPDILKLQDLIQKDLSDWIKY